MNYRSALVVLFGAVIIAGFFAGVGFGEQNRGVEMMTLFGGNTGNVSFPHHQHQDTLKDCNICHAVFTQKIGIIEEMKSQKKLAKKQVMNKQCIKCHKLKKKAGEKTGPTSCKKCHNIK